MITLIGKAHSKIVFARRVRVLADTISAMVPADASVLDVGCGDGTIASLIRASRPDIAIEGLDVMVRPSTKIPVAAFDGRTLPAADGSYDVVLFVDVLHHTLEPGRLLTEAARVARKAVIVKDHVADNGVDRSILSFMDWVGNAPHGVALPYNYQSRSQWDTIYARCRLHATKIRRDVPLYPWPLSMIFGRTLHFVATLTPARDTRTASWTQSGAMVQRPGPAAAPALSPIVPDHTNSRHDASCVMVPVGPRRPPSESAEAR